jgi:peptidyl-prolyl cis-trans isomerase A (cyclophilin A)
LNLESRAASVVRFDTVLGSFDVQLFDSVTPDTVQNFLGYVNTDRYDGTVIHRNSDTADPILRDFVIQGGGFSLNDPDPPNPSSIITFSNVSTDPPINDEPGGGVAGPSNIRGTIAMAKSGPNTVTSQFFINQGDNSFLDDPNRGDGGFSAFGWVLGDGMDIVDAIGDLPLPTDFLFSIGSPFNDLPLRNFSGTSIIDIRVEHTVTVNSVSELTTLPGDFNLDGTVGDDDLAILETGYGIAAGAFLDDGDADMDGDVDGADFLLWQENHGETLPLSAINSVPEPTTLLLLCLGALATPRAARRIIRR